MMRSHLFLLLLAFLAANTLRASAENADISVRNVRVEGTNLTVVLTNARVLSGPELTGFSLAVAEETGQIVVIRIDGAQPDDSGQDFHWLYDLKKKNVDGDWVPFCGSGPEGKRLGFPVAGWIDPKGLFRTSDEAMTFSCTGGAIAKCIRMGYGPWNGTTAPDSMLARFQACTRMVRADYCGTGQSQTRNGTPINVYDRLSLGRSGSAPGMVFEAAWGPGGALCVAKTRLRDLITLDRLRSMCGEKLAGKLGQVCKTDTAHLLSGALIFNESAADQ